MQDIAVAGLQEGYESPSLYILAGLEKNEVPSVIDYYIKQTLAELNIPFPVLPITRNHYLERAVHLVEDIIAGNKAVIEGTTEIVHTVLFKFDFHAENKIYCFDSIGFEKAYGLYDTYDELLNADYPWQPGKTNEQLMTIVEKELFDELVNWHALIKSTLQQ